MRRLVELQRTPSCLPPQCIPDLEGHWIWNNNPEFVVNIVQSGSDIEAVWISRGESCRPESFYIGQTTFEGLITGQSSPNFNYNYWWCSSGAASPQASSLTISIEEGEYVLLIKGWTFRRQ